MGRNRQDICRACVGIHEARSPLTQRNRGHSPRGRTGFGGHPPKGMEKETIFPRKPPHVSKLNSSHGKNHPKTHVLKYIGGFTEKCQLCKTLLLKNLFSREIPERLKSKCFSEKNP